MLTEVERCFYFIYFKIKFPMDPILFTNTPLQIIKHFFLEFYCTDPHVEIFDLAIPLWSVVGTIKIFRRMFSNFWSKYSSNIILLSMRYYDWMCWTLDSFILDGRYASWVAAMFLHFQQSAAQSLINSYHFSEWKANLHKEYIDWQKGNIINSYYKR